MEQTFLVHVTTNVAICLPSLPFFVTSLEATLRPLFDPSLTWNSPSSSFQIGRTWLGCYFHGNGAGRGTDKTSQGMKRPLPLLLLHVNSFMWSTCPNVAPFTLAQGTSHCPSPLPAMLQPLWLFLGSRMWYIASCMESFSFRFPRLGRFLFSPLLVPG